MGYIYIIKNNKNDLVYIGQTKQSIEERFKQHIYAALSGIRKTKLYNAINDIGYTHFYVEKLEECENIDLNRKEIEYIKKYNSYNNGYNSTLGGENNYTKISEINFDKFIEDYNNNLSMVDIAVKHGIVIQTAMKLRDRLGLGKRELVHVGSSDKIALNMYDKHFNYLCSFNSIKEAIEHLGVSNFGYCYIKQSTLKGNIAYGYRWQNREDLLNCSGEYNSIFDKYEHMILGKRLVVDNFGKQRALGIDYSDYIGNSVKEKCEICGNYIIDGICETCEKREIRAEQRDDKINKIAYLASLGMSLSDIGREVGMTSNGVKRVCIGNGIEYATKFTNENIIMMDKYGNINYTTVNEAADFLIQSGISKATKYSIRTKIKKVLDTGRVAFGYTWSNQ